MVLTHEPAVSRVAPTSAGRAPELTTAGELDNAAATLPELERFPASAVAAAEPIRWRIAQLAEIWPPYDPASGVIVHLTPLPPDEIADIERRGYTVVAPVRDRWPYTHVITTWPRDYLAALVPATAASSGSPARGAAYLLGSDQILDTKSASSMNPTCEI